MRDDWKRRVSRAYIAREQARRCVSVAEQRAAPWRYYPGAMVALYAAWAAYERADLRVYRLLRERDEARLPTWAEICRA